MFYDDKTCKAAGVKTNKVFDGKVAQADRKLKSNVMEKNPADLALENEQFLCKNVEFPLLNNLVKEVIIGLKVLK